MVQTPLKELEFAVLDFETTGLFPHRSDRVVEVGVVRVDGAGRVLAEYTSLVQPGRDLGPTRVHGLRARDVADAPTFQDIAGSILALLEGAVLVGHNVSFDERFLEAECARMGLEFPPVPRLCTLRLGLELGMPPPPRRGLQDACAYYGIDQERPHSALDDARSASRLLGVYLGLAEAQGRDSLHRLGCDVTPAPPAAWPRLPPGASALRREEASARPPTASSYLGRLIQRLPAIGSADAKHHATYLALLDRALEDRRLTSEEVEALAGAAKLLGLSAEDLARAHRTYLDELAAAANADGRVTDIEARDLEEAATLLGFGPVEVAASLQRTARAAIVNPPATGPALVGATVCFTGALQGAVKGAPLSREEAHRLATLAGLEVRTHVSKHLDLLVVADPETLSTKAKKAREYGTRIMSEVVFFRSIGVALD